MFQMCPIVTASTFQQDFNKTVQRNQLSCMRQKDHWHRRWAMDSHELEASSSVLSGSMSTPWAVELPRNKGRTAHYKCFHGGSGNCKRMQLCIPVGGSCDSALSYKGIVGKTLLKFLHNLAQQSEYGLSSKYYKWKERYINVCTQSPTMRVQ